MVERVLTYSILVTIVVLQIYSLNLVSQQLDNNIQLVLLSNQQILLYNEKISENQRNVILDQLADIKQMLNTTTPQP